MKNTLTPALKKLAKKLPKAYETATLVAGAQLADDAVNEAPTPPIDTGHLRGSWFVYAQGQLKTKGVDAERFDGLSKSIAVPRGKIMAVVGFNAPYAQIMHDDLKSFGTVYNLGPKSENAGNVNGNFLGAKLLKNKERYKRSFEAKLKKELFK
jgi:hypothetical protein